MSCPAREVLDVAHTKVARRDALPSDLNKRRRRIEARDVRAPVGGDAAKSSRTTS